MEYDIHTVLDLLTLAATIWVVYTMRFTPLKNTYQKDQDTIKVYYVVRAPASLAVGLCTFAVHLSVAYRRASIARGVRK